MNLGSRYVQLLQGQPDPNNGTIYGGLASALQKGMMGYAMGQDRAEEEAKQGRLAQALQMYSGSPGQTIQWNQTVRPEGFRDQGMGDPTTTYGVRAPDPMGAASSIADIYPELSFSMTQAELARLRDAEAAGNELMQVPHPDGSGSMIYVTRNELGSGSLAQNAPRQPGPEIRQQMLPGDMVQDMKFNPQTGQEEPVGDPYPRWQSRAAPSASMKNVVYPDGRVALLDMNNPTAVAAAQAAGATLGDESPTGPAMPYEGNAMDAQNANILLMDDPASPRYLAAWNMMAQPRTTLDVTTGQMIEVKPDMSAYRRPVTQNTPPLQSGMGDAGGVTTTQVTDAKPTVDQNDAAIFATMMQGADNIIGTLPADVTTSFWQSALSGVPVAGNYANSREYQKYKQATDDFVNAWLRRTSGAAISQSEYASAAQQFFPQPGDGPEVIAQKQASRQRALDGLISAAGGAYTPAPTEGASPVYVLRDGKLVLEGAP